MSDTTHIIEKRLIWINRNSRANGLLLSSLKKEYAYASREFTPFLYQVGGTIYSYAAQGKGFVSGTELLEYEIEAALSAHSEIREELIKKGSDPESHFLIYELGYDENLRYGDDDLTPQINLLWPHLDEFFADKEFVNRVKTAFSSNASYFYRNTFPNIDSVERLRTSKTCSYFNRTMQLMLILLLDDRWLWDDARESGYGVYGDNLPEINFNERKAGMLELPPEFSIIACGKPAGAESFPEFPTDIWLVKKELGTEKILGVYTTEIDSLAEELLETSADELFPVEDYIQILDEFYDKAFNTKDHNSYGLIIEAFLRFESEFLAARKEAERVQAEKELEQKRLAAISQKNWDALNLEAVNFSVRTFNALKRSGVITIAGLITMSADDLKKIRNLNQKCIDEIVGKLTDLGIRTDY